MDKKHNHNTGHWGEEMACKYIQSLGWQVLERNCVLRFPGVRQSVGEIDIVAKCADVIVFIEVKARNGSKFGGSLEAITFAKEKKLRLLAEVYMRRHYPDNSCRFDVIGIDCFGGQVKLTHIENAFAG